jgi:hypothetical protein
VGGGVARVSSIAKEPTRWIAPDLEAQFARFDAEFRGVAVLGLLAVARPDGTIDVVRGTEHLAVLAGHRSRILALALSPCGTRLAVADFDGVVCIHAIP